ncbi:phosphomannomutase [Novosphingobium sp. FSY-8]|uniref:Phosphomannomutase n=2 Tax=Novosphingobium ovatum TaxID=1908523 RepID=A0ABW9XGZ2_9SPHN|nr:phosphomannomutase [Novosphingobium ovatum]
MHPSILREYDIRGIYGRTLFDADAYVIGRRFAAVVLAEGGARIAVGRDGRLSSPALEAALVAGLTDGGVDVTRIGLGPTPMLYFAEASMPEQDGGIQITGSHNPGDHNGFKIVFRGRPFFGADIRRLGQMAAVEQAEIGRKGVDRAVCPMAAYGAALLGALKGVDRAALDQVRIGWDTGNGAAGPVMQALIAQLPGEHILLFPDVNGHFPNHHPDPSNAANLADLRSAVLSNHLDFGVAFDGDADRLGIVDARGRIIDGDRLLSLAAADVLPDHPGAMVVADIKTSQAVIDDIARLGGQPLLWKTGHSHIKSKMKETGAILGGEMTGHLFYADRWYGFDDAIYAALRIIAASVRPGRSVTAMHEAMAVMHATPEIRIPVAEEAKFDIVANVAEQMRAAGIAADLTDGLRVTGPDGWWLLRPSNTEAMLGARAESASAQGLARVLAQLDAALAQCGVVRPLGG